MLWSKHFKNKPDILENETVIGSKNYKQIRNDVIHQGSIASWDDAIEFGKIPFNFLRKHKMKLDKEIEKINQELPTFRYIRLIESNERFKEAQSEISKTSEINEEYKSISTVYVPSFLSRDELSSLEDCLDDESNIGL